ncbi:unnamed protein product [Adineta ricciae]|uniref:G-protein coupled receptors family 1 profile domain-containing protein n=1 Tax=Adineta ricciae TaxID=249248 RepID=A0A815QYD5_ADIRI|nr:unnamed protein product [Adineta ricciae]CAF1468594.1 unnamed protein product [Adineta ricciae]
MLIIIITHRKCRTITNLITSNTIVLSMIYSIFQLNSDFHGLQSNWLTNQPACFFRAYCYTAVCISVPTSYVVQAISRLFFSVFYKHKSLLTYRTHIYLIILNYLIAILGALGPMFVPNAYGLEIESRLCLNTTKVFLSSFLAVTIAYLIPLSIIIPIYGIIFLHAQKSTNRVTHLNTNPVLEFSTTAAVIMTTPKIIIPNYKRELKLMRNIIILIMILTTAGLPYLILVIWQVITKEILPPEYLYLLALIIITGCFSIKMITIFSMNKEIKNITWHLIRKLI